MAEEICANCGAPRAAGYASCKYCQTPFVQNAQTDAIPCPQCKTLNEKGAQRCVECQAWLVVQCLFCHAISPHNLPSCAQCGEAFAGAPERAAERQRAARLQQGLQVAGTVGNVAASFLGAAAAAGVFSSPEHHHHRHSYDEPAPAPATGGGFFDSLFSSSSDAPTDAGIAQQSSSSSNPSSSGGFFDSLLGGSGSDDQSSSSSTDGGDDDDSDDSDT